MPANFKAVRLLAAGTKLRPAGFCACLLGFTITKLSRGSRAGSATVYPHHYQPTSLNLNYSVRQRVTRPNSDSPATGCLLFQLTEGKG
jgi:hypothetical protein